MSGEKAGNAACFYRHVNINLFLYVDLFCKHIDRLQLSIDSLLQDGKGSGTTPE